MKIGNAIIEADEEYRRGNPDFLGVLRVSLLSVGVIAGNIIQLQTT